MEVTDRERLRQQGDRPSRTWIWLALLVVVIVAALMVAVAGGGGGGGGGVPAY